MLRQSPLFREITTGALLPDRLEYTLNGCTRRLLSYLADGIYPQYPIFARPLYVAVTSHQRTYNRLHEDVRKDVERMFSVLTSH